MIADSEGNMNRFFLALNTYSMFIIKTLETNNCFIAFIVLLNRYS